MFTISLTTFVASSHRVASSLRLPGILTLAVLCAPAMLVGQPQYPCKCARKPAYTTPPPQPAFGTPAALAGQMAISTTWAKGFGSMLADQVVMIWNVKPNGGAVPNQNWSTNLYYSDSRWNSYNLGDVFGLTLDDKGNIYVTATTVHGLGPNPTPPRTGALANPQWFNKSGDHGQIYKIDNTTGKPSAFYQLPNPHGAGLGNITYDCDSTSFYVSNFDDGRIYRLGWNKFGKLFVQGTWDHGQKLNLATNYSGQALNRPPINPIAGQAAQLGRRPWAVRIFNGRLYYSMWNMDSNHPFGPYPNEIWSIDRGLAGPARLEATMPLLGGVFGFWNNPVADLTFTSTGNMVTAERTMGGMVFTGQSRVLEFAPGWNGFAQTPKTYSTGCIVGPGGYANAAGGVAYDYLGSSYRVWATSYLLHRNTAPYWDWVDGLQGFPANGGSVSTSLLIDMDGATGVAANSETQLGAVNIPCPSTDAAAAPVAQPGPGTL